MRLTARSGCSRSRAVEEMSEPNVDTESVHLSNELVLVARVIFQAITDALSRRPMPARGKLVTANLKTRRVKWEIERQRARHWLLNEACDADANTPFTLEWCCMQLDIASSVVRQRVRKTLGTIDDYSVRPYTFVGTNEGIGCLR